MPSKCKFDIDNTCKQEEKLSGKSFGRIRACGFPLDRKDPPCELFDVGFGFRGNLSVSILKSWNRNS